MSGLRTGAQWAVSVMMLYECEGKVFVGRIIPFFPFTQLSDHKTVLFSKL